jgi:hypothetical protein
VLLLGVPALIIAGFLVSFAWGTVADRYGRPIAADRAAEVEERARAAGLTADQVTSEAVLGNATEVRRLAVPGTRFVAIRPPSGAGDAHIVLRSTAWAGIHCIVLAIGADGDISTVIRRCA